MALSPESIHQTANILGEVSSLTHFTWTFHFSLWFQLTYLLKVCQVVIAHIIFLNQYWSHRCELAWDQGFQLKFLSALQSFRSPDFLIQKNTDFTLPEVNTAFCRAHIRWMFHCWLMVELCRVVLVDLPISFHVSCHASPCPLLSAEEFPVEPACINKEKVTFIWRVVKLCSGFIFV